MPMRNMGHFTLVEDSPDWLQTLGELAPALVEINERKKEKREKQEKERLDRERQDRLDQESARLHDAQIGEYEAQARERSARAAKEEEKAAQRSELSALEAEYTDPEAQGAPFLPKADLGKKIYGMEQAYSDNPFDEKKRMSLLHDYVPDQYDAETKKANEDAIKFDVDRATRIAKATGTGRFAPTKPEKASFLDTAEFKLTTEELASFRQSWLDADKEALRIKREGPKEGEPADAFYSRVNRARQEADDRKAEYQSAKRQATTKYDGPMAGGKGAPAGDAGGGGGTKRPSPQEIADQTVQPGGTPGGTKAPQAPPAPKNPSKSAGPDDWDPESRQPYRGRTAKGPSTEASTFDDTVEMAISQLEASLGRPLEESEKEKIRQQYRLNSERY